MSKRTILALLAGFFLALVAFVAAVGIGFFVARLVLFAFFVLAVVLTIKALTKKKDDGDDS